jgi:CyaY protein
MSEPISEPEFERVADMELHQLLEAIIDCSDAIDPDLQSGVLSIVFEDGSKHVVNSHRAARQIWMAADRHAWHFDYDRPTSKWMTPAGDELWATVSRVLGNKLGEAVTLHG